MVQWISLTLTFTFAASSWKSLARLVVSFTFRIPCSVHFIRPIYVGIVLLLSALPMRHRVGVEHALRPVNPSIILHGKGCQSPLSSLLLTNPFLEIPVESDSKAISHGNEGDIGFSFPPLVRFQDHIAAYVGQIPSQGCLGKIVGVVVDPRKPRRGGQAGKPPLEVRVFGHLRRGDERNAADKRVSAHAVATMEGPPFRIAIGGAVCSGRHLEEQESRRANDRCPEGSLGPTLHRRISY